MSTDLSEKQKRNESLMKMFINVIALIIFLAGVSFILNQPANESSGGYVLFCLFISAVVAFFFRVCSIFFINMGINIRMVRELLEKQNSTIDNN